MTNNSNASDAAIDTLDSQTASAAAVFDMTTVESALLNIHLTGKVSLLDATLNDDGSYTVANNGQVWAGPLSGPNEFGGDGLELPNVRYFNPQTGVIQFELGMTPNGLPAENGRPEGAFQGQIVGWNGDSFIIKLYGALNPQTGQLSDPLTSSADQAAYVVFSGEDMSGTNGIPTSGDTFGQPSDAATLNSLAASMGVYPTLPAASVDSSGMVAAVSNNLPAGNAAWVAVTVNSDGTYSATMNGEEVSAETGYMPLDVAYTGWGLDIVASEPGGIVEVGLTLSPGSGFYEDLGFGKIIGWNANGVLLEMYSNYTAGQLVNLEGQTGQFLFLSETSLSGTTIPADAPQVFGQDPNNFPPNFGLAPVVPTTTVSDPLDPSSLVSLNSINFAFSFGGSTFSSGHMVLTDATQNADGSYTLSLGGGEPWLGSVGQFAQSSTDIKLSIAVGYSDPGNGAFEFSFTAASGSTLPTLLEGNFFGKIVGWDGSDVLVQLFQDLDEATGTLSNPVDPSQGPAFMVISETDFTSANEGQGSGVLDGKIFGQPLDAGTTAALLSGMGVSQFAPASAVDLAGLTGTLNGQTSDFGAFVSITNQGGGNFSATDTYKPYISTGSPNYPYNYAQVDLADFTESRSATDGSPGFTIQIDNVLPGGIFEWELDNPDPAPSSVNQHPDGPIAVDHFFAKVIGFNADGILVQDYTGYSNGQLTGPVSGAEEYAYFSANNLRTTDLQDTPAQFGQDPSQLPNALGVTPAVACFAAGTRLRTARGEIVVEQLSVGELVETASGALRPVKWIGHRDVDCARHPAPEKVWPVRIAAGTFGSGLPVRDLYLSPDHALFVEGVLIPAKLLINHESVEQMPRDAVTYYHVELDSHDVVLAEGLPAESFLDTGNRDSFANGGDAVRLHADFAPSWHSLAWEAQACARLVLHGPELQAARARVAVSCNGDGGRRTVAA